MNTFAMVITVAGTGFCYVPGFWGWLGIAMAITGVIIGIIGITSVKTSPGNLGMDVASWIYGVIALSVGTGFQIKYAAPDLDYLLLPVSEQSAFIIFAVLIPLFIAIQIMARKRWRWRYALIAVAVILYFAVCSSAWTAITLIDRAKKILPFL